MDKHSGFIQKLEPENLYGDEVKVRAYAYSLEDEPVSLNVAVGNGLVLLTVETEDPHQPQHIYKLDDKGTLLKLNTSDQMIVSRARCVPARDDVESGIVEIDN